MSETPSDKQKVLIVDDTPENIQVLMETLKEDYAIVAAINGEKALKMAAAEPAPDIILLDVMMPGMDGFEVCKKLKADKHTRDIPVIFITALTEAAEEAKGLALGAVDYLNKPFNPDLVKARIRNHLDLKRYRDRLETLVKERTRELALTQAITIESLATLAEYRDPETGGHVKRTQNYVKALAVQLKGHPRFRDELTDDAIEQLYRAAPLHDIGKVGVPDHILLKEGRLTDEEFEEMKMHVIYGRDALRVTEEKMGKNSFLKYVREIASSHQEKWDGSGYPEGLKGNHIPLSGRLMALADVYDALISKRPYKPPYPHEKALEIITEGRGTHFDPDIVDAFIEIGGTFRNIALTFADFDEEREMRDLNGEGPVEKILLVEDNEINLEIMASQLLSAGYQVETARDGKEALAKWESGDYDALLTDLEMPEMDGYTLVSEIRGNQGGASKRPPILAITASDFDLTEERARGLGFDGYLLKPLELNVLKRKLASIPSNDRDQG